MTTIERRIHMISIHEATVRFDSHEPVEALTDVTLSIQRGEWISIL